MNVWKCKLIFPTDTLQQKIAITDLKPFLAAENTSLLIILASTVCLPQRRHIHLQDRGVFEWFMWLWSVILHTLGLKEFVERSCFIPTLRCSRKSDAFAFREASAESGVMMARCCEVKLYSGLKQSPVFYVRICIMSCIKMDVNLFCEGRRGRFRQITALVWELRTIHVKNLIKWWIYLFI